MPDKPTFSITQIRRSFASAKNRAKHEPVYITYRGKITHVLMSYEEYRRLIGRTRSAADVLYMPGAADVEFEPPRLDGKISPE
jgi:prevent-host-death family protein